MWFVKWTCLLFCNCVILISDQDLCKEVFVTHPAAGCTLYDDSKCNGEEGMKTMKSGWFLLTDQTKLELDVESVSIRKGCYLTIYSGIKFAVSIYFSTYL